MNSKEIKRQKEKIFVDQYIKMSAFINPNNNGPSLTGVIDVTAHNIS